MAVDKTIPLSFADGVDNRAHETRLDDGFVRKAENIDIDPNAG